MIGKSTEKSLDITSPNSTMDVSTVEEDNGTTNSKNGDASFSCVQVAVRVRPFLPQEAGNDRCVEILGGGKDKRPNCIRMGDTDNGTTFTFDETFAPNTTQRSLFQISIHPLVMACLEGYNATVLAYGQTGSGKTYTILGPQNAVSVEGETIHNGDSEAGVIPRALHELFHQLNTHMQEMNKDSNSDEASEEGSKGSKSTTLPYEYEVRVQFLELYGEEIRDLLTTQLEHSKLTIRDGGSGIEPEVIGASEVKVSSADEAILCLTRGTLRRVTGATAMNSESSRSHAIMTVVVEQSTVIAPTSNEQEGHTEVETKRSKFHFVDLAGSERQKRSQAEGKRLKEGIDINKGLLVLGNVISALGDPKKRGKTFVPYRDSKLTRLLKGSLGGNHKTLMIACVSPSSSNMEESINCLRYANRAKNIKNNAIVNQDAGSRMIAELREQVKALATELIRTQDAPHGHKFDPPFTRPILESLANGNDPSSLNIQALTTPKNVSGQSTVRTNNNHFNFTPATNVSTLTSYSVETKSEIDKITNEYEQELDWYRNQLKIANKLNLAENIGNLPGNGINETYTPRESLITRTNQIIENERSELVRLQEDLGQSSPILETSLDGDDTTISPKSTIDEENDIAKNFEEDSSIEDQPFKNITDKYLKLSSHSDMAINDVLDDSDRNFKLGDFVHETKTENNDDDDDENGKNEAFTRRQEHLSTHITTLSKSIAAKEELIEQLRQSQERYETMRAYYEGKLLEMKNHLKMREDERDVLNEELKKHEEDSQRFRELKSELALKDNHITKLKKKQRDLKNLTEYSASNQNVIQRLREDIVSMKKQKHDLQRQIMQERKNHAEAVKQLRKEASRRTREVNKSKTEVKKKEMMVQRAQRMSKKHLEEASRLRVKYRDAEKRLRMQTLKRGVMEKAGIDPVMIGNRNRRNDKTKASIRGRKIKTANDADIDLIRTFFDEKVAEIGRKENTADKIAHEWEDHLELSQRKAKVLQTQDEAEPRKKDIYNEELEGLEIQIQYKQGRIRQLSRRLGKKLSTSSDYVPMNKNFFSDDTFKNLCKGLSPLASAQVSLKVLFGMVVRERKRVASLARTASILDQKALEYEELVYSKEEAMRTWMEEQRHERTTMAQNQQSQILSLMSLVQAEDEKISGEAVFDEGRASNTSETVNSTSKSIDWEQNKITQSPRPTSSQSLVMRLANERIGALERELLELQGEKETKDNYKEQLAEVNESLKGKLNENEELKIHTKIMKTELRRIRDKVTKQIALFKQSDADEIMLVVSSSKIFDSINNIVENILKTPVRSPRKILNPNSSLSPSKSIHSTPPRHPQTGRNYQSLDDSDSDDDYEPPEWTGGIMEDLEVIASGKVPSSMAKSVRSNSSTRARSRSLKRSNLFGEKKRNTKDSGTDTESVNVFDRLTDPGNFTGVQRTTYLLAKEKQRNLNDPAETSDEKPRKLLHRSISHPESNHSVHDDRDTEISSGDHSKLSNQSGAHTSGENKETSQQASHRSVFQRLQSPSSYTGTQKAVHIKPKRNSENSDLDNSLKITPSNDD